MAARHKSDWSTYKVTIHHLIIGSLLDEYKMTTGYGWLRNVPTASYKSFVNLSDYCIVWLWFIWNYIFENTKRKNVDEHKKDSTYSKLASWGQMWNSNQSLVRSFVKVTSTHWKHKILWFKLKCYGPKTSLRRRVKATHQQLFLHSK